MATIPALTGVSLPGGVSLLQIIVRKYKCVDWGLVSGQSAADSG
jgi:hypothetical protein